ncbi:NUDIX hydrolase [Brevibacillus daliensis]|uniref:NUDIX hydrolase n=1 Tax=Brevibacillus daliensis TaxID=2892995 RepID=UPI001E5B102B|nr:NUDIX domain-containing protein [Brevibacillus daliensis]
MIQYVKEMRSLIGQKPLLLCGSSVIILDLAGKVLLLQRQDNHCWCFPGGSMDLGESLEETAKREVLEETGVTITTMEMFGVFSGEELHYTYPHGDEVYNVDVTFISTEYEGQVQIDEESLDFDFFSLDNLPTPISPPSIPILRELCKRKGSSLHM